MRIRVLALSMFLVAIIVWPLAVYAKGPATRSQTGHTIENQYIKIVVAEEGTPNMGTTGGRPEVSGDESKPLLFGYPASRRTGFPSVRVIKADKTIDTRLDEKEPLAGPSRAGDTIVTVWNVEGVQVEQTIGFFTNPYSGVPDMMSLTYKLENLSGGALQTGVRCMLDTQVGTNDYAPFFLPGVGQTDRELDISGGNLPTYYKVYESPAYSENELRGMGFVKGHGLATPDRFVLATWKSARGEGAGIFDTTWDYAITPGARLGDSSVAYWWNPRSLGNNESFTVQTAYGLASPAGGTASLAAPSSAGCDAVFDVTLTVNNTSLEDLDGGQATLSLPGGLALAAGESASKSLGGVAAGQVAVATWRVQRDGSDPASATLSASVSFDNLPEPLVAVATVSLADCRPPTATPTLTPTVPFIPYMSPTPTAEGAPTATPTAHVPIPTATATPAPPPEIPEPTSLLLLVSGLAALGALAKSRRAG